MRYVKWFASQTSGLKANMAVRIVAGVAQVGCGLLLVVLCRHFIDRGIWQAGVAKEIMAIFAVHYSFASLWHTARQKTV